MFFQYLCVGGTAMMLKQYERLFLGKKNAQVFIFLFLLDIPNLSKVHMVHVTVTTVLLNKMLLGRN
jgi:hypothetical protein